MPDTSEIAKGLSEQEQRDREADLLLASLSDAQLHAGLRRANENLALLRMMEQEEPVWDGPFPPSKAYENWDAADIERRRRAYSMAKRDVEAELARRAHLQEKTR